MTTLDQARAVAQRLRNVHVEIALRRDFTDAANTIDALVAEVERLKEEVQRHAALCKWYAEDNVTINAQIKTYQEREKTMGWSQS